MVNASKSAQIAVLSLVVDDLEAAVRFYRDVLGFEFAGYHGNMPHFNLQGVHFVLRLGEPPHMSRATNPFPQVAFTPVDFQTAVDRLRAHAVELPWGIEESSGARWVRFFDPAGNLIELVTFKS